jgi:hypothetical protein
MTLELTEITSTLLQKLTVLPKSGDATNWTRANTPKIQPEMVVLTPLLMA